MALRTLSYGIDLPRHASVMTAVLLLGGIDLIGTGAKGEYIGRIYDTTQERPLYLGREQWSTRVSRHTRKSS